MVTPDDISLESVYEFVVWVTVDGKPSQFGSVTKTLIVGCPDTPLISISFID